MQKTELRRGAAAVWPWVSPFLFWVSVRLLLTCLCHPHAPWGFKIEDKELVEVLGTVFGLESCSLPCWLKDPLSHLTSLSLWLFL